jgi:MraZ protein
VYLGEFAHTLDTEGRLALPARLREALGDELTRGLCLTCGAEPCIVAYTRERFQALLSSVTADPGVTRSEARAFKRALGGRTAVVAPDKQGRILIPEALRRAAHIAKDVTILGAIDAIEIWDRATYAERAGRRRAAFERMAPRIFD